MNTGEKNYFINALLFIAGLASIVTGILMDQRAEFINSMGALKNLHIWMGYALAVLLIVHLLMHVKWIKACSVRVFSDKKKALAFTAMVLAACGICYLLFSNAPERGFQERRGFGPGYRGGSGNPNNFSYPVPGEYPGQKPIQP